MTSDMEKGPLDRLAEEIGACPCSCIGLNKPSGREKVNLWNCWQGALGAPLMLIGQDFGNIHRQYVSVEDMKRGLPWHEHPGDPDLNKWVATDRAIYELFRDVFGIDLTEHKRLFFTNMVCCYRTGNNAGNVPDLDCWLPRCAEKHMGRLLRLIRPKAVIVLGEKTFEALSCCENAVLSRQKPPQAQVAPLKGFAGRIKFDYTLTFSDDPKLSIRVFPTYHPSHYRGNDAKALQVRDWETLRDKLIAFDSNILLECNQPVSLTN